MNPSFVSENGAGQEGKKKQRVISRVTIFVDRGAGNETSEKRTNDFSRDVRTLLSCGCWAVISGKSGMTRG